ncbi:hypothetical protein [Nannocystis exedens]|uniref:hypothetical protein n=1 Tax=Nannocystis exedens TaxID=54 RepID=UPI001472C458|nr:hypothetical protein [Nannocystis exedens]
MRQLRRQRPRRADRHADRQHRIGWLQGQVPGDRSFRPGVLGHRLAAALGQAAQERRRRGAEQRAEAGRAGAGRQPAGRRGRRRGHTAVGIDAQRDGLHQLEDRHHVRTLARLEGRPGGDRFFVEVEQDRQRLLLPVVLLQATDQHRPGQQQIDQLDDVHDHVEAVRVAELELGEVEHAALDLALRQDLAQVLQQGRQIAIRVVDPDHAREREGEVPLVLARDAVEHTDAAVHDLAVREDVHCAPRKGNTACMVRFSPE